MKPWTLADAQQLIKELQDAAQDFGYEFTLGGTVLTTGSGPALSICLFCFNEEDEGDSTGVITWLSQLWGPPVDQETYPQYQRLTFERPGDRIYVRI